MKRLSVVIIVATLFASLALLQVHTAEAGFSLFGTHKQIKSDNGFINIQMNKVSDGEAHYYHYKHNGQRIKFFVVQSRDGVIRAAFDACDVCFPAQKGYSQDGEFMICNNCGQRFHVSRINVVKGGCNPAPLKREVAGNNLVIAVKDIIAGARFFQEG